MYNFEINKERKEKLLREINFTNRQKTIFELLTNDCKRHKIPSIVGCSKRTIDYEIKNIANKITAFDRGLDNETYDVYIHIFPNGKKYVGVSKNIDQRWGTCGIPYQKNINMYKDIIKYGWENIKHEILTTTSSSFKARELERKIIEIFDLTDEQKGYNLRT